MDGYLLREPRCITRGPRLSKEDQNWRIFGDFPRMANPLYPFDIPEFQEKRA
jgi:hypothetical protein